MSESEKLLQLEEEIIRLKKEAAAVKTIQEEKNRIELAYTDSQIRFRTIFEESVLGKKIINADLKIIKVNDALLKLLGYSEIELLGIRVTDIAHPDFIERWKELQHELWTTKKTSFSIDTCIIKKDKTPFWCHVTSIIFPDHSETLGYTILEDITERKEFERIREEVKNRELLLERKGMEQRQQEELFKVTLDTQEEERKRIAESLHNGLGQLLFGVKLSLGKINLETTDQENENLLALQQTEHLLLECIRESRRISHELTPAVLIDFGLKDAVEGVCQQLSGSVEFKCEFKGLPRKLDKYKEIAIYRIVQELMLNVVKHAEATNANTKIEADNKYIVITVEDNGKGFDVPKSKIAAGIGLKTIKSKVDLLNGKLQVSSTPGHGTIITIRLPNKNS